MDVRSNRAHSRFLALSAFALAIAVGTLRAPFLSAQSLTTGAIAGVVEDPSGAVVPNATVTATNLGTGSQRTATSQPDGTYTVSLLVPGQYSIKVAASGFRTADQSPITVQLATTTSLNVKLEIGQASQTVEVSGAAPLIETENPNTTTNVNATALATLPNPGNDLSYVAQVAPGAVMNTSGGYGNMEFNGLPATSTNFSIDGMDANDPFLNLNNSGATNLQLGLNSMQEASINTLSFSVDQGRQGAAQVNFISKSGTNQIHGNLFETWNGSSMNAVNYFINATPGAAVRPFSNVNQFGGSIGGPIKHDKLFYFFDMEGLQIVVPTTQTETYPTTAYENYALAAIPTGGYDPATGVAYAPPANPAAAIAAYKTAFGLYGTPTGGSPIATTDCPLGTNPDGTPAGPLAAGLPTPHGDGCRLTRTFGISNHTHDLYWKARVDQNMGASDHIWYDFSWEKGVQATYTDPVNSVFNAFSTQPQNGAAVGWTHVFSPTLVNDFNPGYYWYSAIFNNSNPTAASAALPYEFRSSQFTPIHGAALDWPQGRNVTNYQFIDNLTWTRGSHEFKFGENLRRTLVSDHDTGFYSGYYLNLGDLATYAYDVVGSVAYHGFPTSTSEPIGLVAFDVYAQDIWKARPNFTVTYGLRATWNGNPVSQHSNFSELKGNNDFFTISHDVTQPLNSIINPHATYLANSTPLIAWQPRASIAWSVRPSTVIRAGGGVFSDIFPASVADGLLENPPNDNIFSGGSPYTGTPITAFYAIPGSGNGLAGDPGNDVFGNIASAQQVSVAGFANGLQSCYVTGLLPPNCLSPGSFTATPRGEFKYPYFIEWNLGVEQQFGNNWAAKLAYVGTRAVDLPFAEQANGFQTVCPGCFAPYIYDPTFNGPDGRFAGVTQHQYGANSIYQALQASLQKRVSHGLTFGLNYTWSHCIDELSNEGSLTGGFDPATSITAVSPGELGRLRANCDYDIRNSLNGNYIYQLPSLMHNRFLAQVFNGWQLSGDLFLHSGYPFSVLSNGYGANGNGVFQGSDPNFAIPTGANPYAKFAHSSTITAPAEIQWLNPSAFTSVVDPNTGSCTAGETIVGGNVTTVNDNAQTCQYARGGRNNVFGPPFKWTDMFISKNFKISERVNFRFDAQFYNLFNHANFGLPGTTAGVPAESNTLSDAFVITGTANPPTSLLGSGLGGDSSVRMIALSGHLTF
jgi:hypothetical protein